MGDLTHVSSDAARQEDQSVIEAEISPEEGDVTTSVEHSLGEDTK